jgi:hypothetical protein
MYINNGNPSSLMRSRRSEKSTNFFDFFVHRILMSIMRSLYYLSILPFFSAFTDAKCDNSKAKERSFDPESLTLREIGARNTVVGCLNQRFTQSDSRE